MKSQGNSNLRVKDALSEAQRRRDAGLPAWGWFDRKVRGHMEARHGLPSTSIAPESMEAVLADRLNQPSARPRTIYVHVPFCTRICTFCSFFRHPKGRSDLQAYTHAVANQIEQMSLTRWAREGPPFAAVYFGGGSPTALEPGQLTRLISAIRERYRLAPDCEFTVECRLDGMDEQYLLHLRDAGVNRLSFGVQSFDTAVRRSVGRIADREQVLETITMAARLGFQQISIDLIYNLPDQPRSSWADDIRTLIGTPATATSVYALIPMQGSALVRQIEAGRRKPLGDCEREYEMFTHSYDELMDRPDWQRFSFHHFGDCRAERSVYNRVRMGTMDTLALGCGAGGRLGTVSYMNAMDVMHYIEAMTHGREAALMVSDQPQDLLDLFAAYQLSECEGVDGAALSAVLPTSAELIERLICLGLVEEQHGRLILTRDGCFWGYNITKVITECIVEHVSPDYQPPTAPHRLHVLDSEKGVIPCSS